MYFAIYNSKRKILGDEVKLETHKASAVLLTIPATLTDLLKVPIGKDCEEYYYGIKLCDSTTGEEDTCVIDDADIGDLNTITVYPKKCEGI